MENLTIEQKLEKMIGEYGVDIRPREKFEVLNLTPEVLADEYEFFCVFQQKFDLLEDILIFEKKGKICELAFLVATLYINAYQSEEGIYTRLHLKEEPTFNLFKKVLEYLFETTKWSNTGMFAKEHMEKFEQVKQELFKKGGSKYNINKLQDELNSGEFHGFKIQPYQWFGTTENNVPIVINEGISSFGFCSEMNSFMECSIHMFGRANGKWVSDYPFICEVIDYLPKELIDVLRKEYDERVQNELDELEELKEFEKEFEN